MRGKSGSQSQNKIDEKHDLDPRLQQIGEKYDLQLKQIREKYDLKLKQIREKYDLKLKQFGEKYDLKLKQFKEYRAVEEEKLAHFNEQQP